jgi:hypothetical protein
MPTRTIKKGSLNISIMNNKIQRMIDRNNGKHNSVVREKSDPCNIQHRLKIDKDQTITERERYIPILTQCDVLVVGGGPSGISAAIGAARTGVDTVIVEKYGCLGGVITTVGMETLGWYRYEGTLDCQGIGTEMEAIAAKMGSKKWPYNNSECLDADVFKIIADQLIEDNKIRPILHCYAVECIIEDNTLRGIITESKSGRQAILAKRVIDCTGDGDICYLAGAPYVTLAKKDRMGVTTVFGCAGIDKNKFMDYVNNNKRTYADWGDDWSISNDNHVKHLPSPCLDQEFKTAMDLGIIPKSSSNITGTWSSLSDAGEATNLNLVHMNGVDCTNVMDLTHAEIQGRKQTLDAITALKALVPGFEQAKLRNFGMTIGTRDSRKIVGEYNLTGHDVTHEARFDDVIGIFPEFLDGYNVLMIPTTGRYFHVPLRCLIPLKIDNLLAAGRCSAGDNISHAAMRNMMACTVTGQGAGVAAAVSVLNNEVVRDVNIHDVQRELLKQNVNLYPTTHSKL